MQIAHNKTILTKKDLVKMQWISVLKGCYLAVLFAVIFVLMAFRIRNGEFVFESWFFAAVGMAIIPVYFLIFAILIYKQNKKVAIETGFDYDFTDTKIIAVATDLIDFEKMEVTYPSIKKFSVEKKYIIVMIDKNTSFVIDKKGFDKEEDLNKVISLLKLKTQPSQKKR